MYFANELPDIQETRPVIEKFLGMGAIGIGEQKFPVEADSSYIDLIASIAEKHRVPVLLHFEFQHYNLNIDRFYRVLDRHPRVNFIGHAQTWWCNIDKGCDQKTMYPTGPVTPGGITDRLLSDYPNMYGDLSAGSGLNSHAAGRGSRARFPETASGQAAIRKRLQRPAGQRSELPGRQDHCGRETARAGQNCRTKDAVRQRVATAEDQGLAAAGPSPFAIRVASPSPPCRAITVANCCSANSVAQSDAPSFAAHETPAALARGAQHLPDQQRFELLRRVEDPGWTVGGREGRCPMPGQWMPHSDDLDFRCERARAAEVLQDRDHIARSRADRGQRSHQLFDRGAFLQDDIARLLFLRR